MLKNNSKRLKELSIFFPCYNEEDNLPVLLNEAIEVLPNVAEKFEIIVVNDGSTDNTQTVAEKFAKKYPYITVINQKNQGYGGAVNTGMKFIKYDWVFFTDADLQFNLKDLYKFVRSADKADLIIGYRKNRAEGLKRNVFAKGMKLWNYIWLGMPLFVKDIDCAFKLIKKDVIKDVGDLCAKGNLVSTEFLLSAYKNGYSFYQIGVVHYPRKNGVSKCGGLKDIFKVIKETFLLRGIMRVRHGVKVLPVPAFVR